MSRPLQALASVLLLIQSGIFTIYIGTASLARGGRFALIDVFFGILLIVAAYLIFRMRHLKAGTITALVIGALVIAFWAATARKSEIALATVFEGLLPMIAGVLGFSAQRKMMQHQKTPHDLLTVVRLHERIGIGELATRFKTTELEIELLINDLQEKNQPIHFNKETREVVYAKKDEAEMKD